MTALIEALIQLGISLEPELAQLIAAGIEALLKLLSNSPPATAGVVANIVMGIDKDYPAYDSVRKHRMVYDSVAVYLEGNNCEANESVINTLIEIAVQANNAGTLATLFAS